MADYIKGKRFGGTLADELDGFDNVMISHPALAIPEGINDSNIAELTEAMWKAYDESPAHFKEAKGARQAIRSFYNDYPAEGDRTYLNFQKGGYAPDWDEKTFNHEHKYSYEWYKPEGESSAAESEAEAVIEDNRPEWNAEENTDPILAMLAQAAEEESEAELSVAESVEEKYAQIYDGAKRIASGRSLKHHAFICGDAGVGKSYSVEKAIEKGLQLWKPNKRDRVKPEYVQKKGSIGKSMTPILIYFFKNREGKLILLDDADGFILATDQDIQNFLKGMLDPNMKPVGVSPTIRAIANKTLQAEFKAEQARLGESLEGKRVVVNTERLAEGKCNVKVGGYDIDFDCTKEEAKQLAECFGYMPKSLKEAVAERKARLTENAYVKFDKFGRLNRMTEADESIGWDSELGAMSAEEQEIYEAAMNGAEIDDAEKYLMEAPQIPEDFQFRSSLILISNLRLSEVNDAVRSRCDCYEITLTKEEFMYRCEQILASMDVGSDSSTDTETVEWAKRESFAIFKSIIAGTGLKNFPFKIDINVPLEFRLVAGMTGRWLARYDRWCEANNREGTSPEDYKEAEKALIVPFAKYDLKKMLAGDQARAGVKKAKK